MQASSVRRSDTLMCYQGGGYDGCLWEWNFGVWDHAGEWHSIIASGCDGCKTEAEALKYIDDEDTRRTGNEYYLHDLTLAEDVKDFATAYHSGLTVIVADAVNKLYPEPVLYWICADCGQHFHYAHPGVFPAGGWSGDGGISVSPKHVVCDECLELGSCCICGEYEGVETLIAGVCEYHWERALAEAPQQAAELEEIEAVIDAGTTQLKTLCTLVPPFAVKYRQQHRASMEALGIKCCELQRQVVDAYSD